MNIDIAPSAMGGRFRMPFAKEHRVASGIAAGDDIEVTLVEDTAERTVDVPDDFATALQEAKLRDTFDRLAYTHRKEHVRAIEEAKKPETRARRIEKAIKTIAERWALGFGRWPGVGRAVAN